MKPKCRILIAESHGTFAELVDRMLAVQNKYEVETWVVQDLEGVIYALSGNFFDAVFLDVSLKPEGDSDFWKSIMETTGPAAVVAVGGPNDFEEMVEVMTNGGFECLFRNLVTKNLLVDYLCRALSPRALEACRAGIRGKLEPQFELSMPELAPAVVY